MFNAAAPVLLELGQTAQSIRGLKVEIVLQHRQITQVLVVAVLVLLVETLTIRVLLETVGRA